MLFGDGAGALVLKRSEIAHLLHPILSATPDVDDVIVVKKEARSTPFSGEVDPISGTWMFARRARMCLPMLSPCSKTRYSYRARYGDHPER